MFKHRLMLSAATVALMSTPALAVGPTDISTKTTTPVKTSDTGNLTIDATGSIEANTATPLITIDSSNTVTNNGKLVDKNTASATAYLFDSTTALTGALTDSSTLVDFTGTGNNKRLLEITNGTNFTGNITTSGTAYNINGDGSVGYLINNGATFTGNLTTGGALTITPTSASTTASSGIVGIDLLGTINGNVIQSGTMILSGNGAQGIVVNAAGFTGTLVNAGVIQVAGITTRDTKKVNPEGGSVVTINSNIGGGFINAAAAQLVSLGTAPGVQVTPTGVTPIVLGPVGTAYAPTNTFGYGFINMGTISVAPEDNNQVPTITGVSIGGSTSALATVTINGGLLNESIISASSTSLDNTNTPLQASHAIGLFIGSYSTVPVIDNIGTGVKIQGIVGGPADGGSNPSTGIGLYIDANASVPELNNLNGASILGQATTTDTSISGLKAIGIEDVSGTLKTIRNAGTISAAATTLDANNQVTTAIDVSHNTTGVTILDGDPDGTFTNHYTSLPESSGAAAGTPVVGVIQGDIRFGSGNDILTITGGTIGGTATNSTVAGNLYFGGTADSTHYDQLNVNDLGVFTGGITSAAGNVDIKVASTASFNLNNTSLGTQTIVHDLDVASGGQFTLTVAPGIPGTTALHPGIVSATDEITLASGSLLSVSFGGFINSSVSSTTPYVLLDAPGGALTIPDAQDYINAFDPPFLFTGDLCTVNVNAATDCDPATVPYTATTHSQLVLAIKQKTAAELNLTGYAYQMYPLVNAVLPLDTNLGSAVLIGSSLNTATSAGTQAAADALNEAAVQSIYDQFAPIATGAARAIAISLTDQATGTIGARQRQLRLYGKEPGDSTMWGVEFAQFLKDPGDVGSPGTTGSPATPVPAGPLSGYKDHGFGFSIGGDGGDSKGGWYGGALTFYTGDAGELGNRSGNTQSEWYMASGYTDWRGRGLFFDSNLNVGLAQFKGKRDLNIDLGGGSTFSRTAVNKHTGLLVAGGFTTGAMLNYGGTTLSPQLSVDAMTMREEGYTESGGGTPGSDAFDLMVKPSYGNSLRAFLGADLRQDIDTGSFFLQPSARFGYRYDFVDGAQKVNASFVGTGLGTPSYFSVLGPDPDRGNLVASLGVGATTDTWSLNVSYDFVRGSSGAMQQNGQFTLVGRI